MDIARVHQLLENLQQINSHRSKALVALISRRSKPSHFCSNPQVRFDFRLSSFLMIMRHCIFKQ